MSFKLSQTLKEKLIAVVCIVFASFSSVALAATMSPSKGTTPSVVVHNNTGKNDVNLERVQSLVSSMFRSFNVDKMDEKVVVKVVIVPYREFVSILKRDNAQLARNIETYTAFVFGYSWLQESEATYYIFLYQYTDAILIHETMHYLVSNYLSFGDTERIVTQLSELYMISENYQTWLLANNY